MELKAYQAQALEQLQKYLVHLASRKQKADADPEAGIDFAMQAWEKTFSAEALYTRHKSGVGQPLPNVCLKVPTGGGKTLLAVKAIDAINTTYRKKRTGLVLWIVPSTQIYDQTLRALRDRSHPYRQHLDIASAGRTTVIERFDNLSPLDVEENLVVMMLMLPAAARQSKETLRMFRDNGGYTAFFPPDDDHQGHAKLLGKIPNLEVFNEDGFWGKQIKTSLGNALRLLAPIVILDEEQRAYSKLAQDTIKGFNPSFVVALSATPPKGSNILIDIRGLDLKHEEMIKLDLHVYNRPGWDHRGVLLAAIERRDQLEQKAKAYEAKTGTYIRPICLIQVERVGKDQRGGGYIHSEDIRELLIKEHGIAPEEIAIKTAEKNELKEADDIGGLLSSECRIRYIITKHALQEGWDCSFAYVLAILNDPHSSNALTQLVGRILRQPYAKKTDELLLDESYVYCYQQDADRLLFSIKRGLEGEGMGDIASSVRVESGSTTETEDERRRIVKVRPRFKGAAKDCILPVFAFKGPEGWRPIDYETDIAAALSWSTIDVSGLCKLALDTARIKEDEIVFGLAEDTGKVGAQDVKTDTITELELNASFISRHMLDIIPNPWQAHAFGEHVIQCLEAEYPKEVVAANSVFILGELRNLLKKEGDRLAEAVFKKLLKTGKIRFMLIGRGLKSNQLPESMKVVESEPYLAHGAMPQRSLFEFMPKEELNGLEGKVALYLEDQKRLFFWFRNRSRHDYYVQGWKKDKVYPDFIFTRASGNKKTTFDKVYVVETKGNHLVGNEDTKYKQALFKLCNLEAEKKNIDDLPISIRNRDTIFEMLTEEGWQGELHKVFN